ncbi:MAG: T9SS type A sorting domain-containing protein [Bacteroidota bacterium]|nr:T9SS type A sorting domain-containing protein [Bacteroidota bacterium]
MKKTAILLLGMLFMWAGQVNAQWSINAVETDYSIDFETTITGISNSIFNGAGFDVPPNAGQLDANSWAIYGFDDGDKPFGDTATIGDFARGASTGGEISGGIYAFEVETDNHALGVQPSTSDFTPGRIGLMIKNNTGQTVNYIDLSYNLWVLNNADRSSSFNGEFSVDAVNWQPIDEFLFDTPEGQDASPVWDKNTLTVSTDMGFELPDGDTIYIRWYSDDVSGSGSRDEIAIDSVTMSLKYDCQPVATFPYTEDFDGSFPPPCWTTEGGTNWQGSATNEAGGTAAEADFYWEPNTTGGQNLISPVINTLGYVSMFLEFKHFLDYNTGGFEIGIATTSDGGATWDTLFAIPPMGNIGPAAESVVINNADMGTSTFQFCFLFDGESSGLNHWYIDDVLVREPYTEMDFLSYSIPEEIGTADINDVAHTIDVDVPFATDVTSLVATFTLSEGASASVSGVPQTSGASSNNFTNSVVYTVTAEDGITTEDWTVTVSETSAPLGSDCTMPFTVNLPADLPYEDLSQTNCGLGNAYDNTQMSSYDNGEDALYEINVTEDIVVDIALDPYSTTYTGLGIFESCPGAVNLIENAGSPTADIRELDSIVLTAGTYFIMVDNYPTGVSCITEYDLIIDVNPVYDYVSNTTLALTPSTQTINVDEDATGILEVNYPASVSPDMPTDLLTDAQIDLSELPAGTVVELFSGASPLGSYTVTGGETVWASNAFSAVSREQAYLTAGNSLEWDIVFSNLTEDTYNVTVTMYLGTDANLDAETNITELDSDIMEIIVEPLLIDLALVQPASGYGCDFTDAEHVPVEFENVGEATIPAGETIGFTYTHGGPDFNEDFILNADLLPGESYINNTSETLDLSAIETYSFEVALEYADDEIPDNNTIEGYIVHFEQEIEFVDAANDTITIDPADYPYSIQSNVIYTPDSTLTPTYLWGDGSTTTSSLEVTEDGVYALVVTTEGCTVGDTVYVNSYTGIEGDNTATLVVYPNPTDGKFMVDMTFVEKQNVVMTIISSSGQVVQKYKFDKLEKLRKSIDLSNMAEGLYNLRINAGDNYYTRQIVVR